MVPLLEHLHFTQSLLHPPIRDYHPAFFWLVVSNCETDGGTGRGSRYFDKSHLFQSSSALFGLPRLCSDCGPEAIPLWPRSRRELRKWGCWILYRLWTVSWRWAPLAHGTHRLSQVSNGFRKWYATLFFLLTIIRVLKSCSTLVLTSAKKQRSGLIWERLSSIHIYLLAFCFWIWRRSFILNYFVQTLVLKILAAGGNRKQPIRFWKKIRFQSRDIIQT